jgi:hypothetical protein
MERRYGCGGRIATRNRHSKYAIPSPVIWIVFQSMFMMAPEFGTRCLLCIRRIDGSADCHPTDYTVLNRTSFMNRGSFVGLSSG